MISRHSRNVHVQTYSTCAAQHPRRLTVNKWKRSLYQTHAEMISVQSRTKNVFGWGMTATHVLMWEWLEDELLFNSVLIGKGVIALCFFFPFAFFFFLVSQQLLTDVVVGSEWMTDSGFSGGWEKKQTKRIVFVWSLPLTTSPSPSLLGELVKISPPPLSFLL